MCVCARLLKYARVCGRVCISVDSRKAWRKIRENQQILIRRHTSTFTRTPTHARTPIGISLNVKTILIIRTVVRFRLEHECRDRKVLCIPLQIIIKLYGFVRHFKYTLIAHKIMVIRNDIVYTQTILVFTYCSYIYYKYNNEKLNPLH